jgi:hypothetical protein
MFESLFSSLAGWHDGVRIRVCDDFSSPLVSVHESIHERIFAETPDGQVHAAFFGALKEDLVADNDRAAVEATVRNILLHSRYAQEVFANYMAIKQLPAASEAKYLGELSTEYCEYFHVLADIIDPHIPTTYLQFLVAWALAVAVFSSELIVRIEKVSPGEPVVLLPDEQPNTRLNQLLARLRSQNLSELRERLCMIARKECESRGIKLWDFVSEEEWTDRIFNGGDICSDGAHIEEAMSKELDLWIRGFAEFPFLKNDFRREVFDRYSDAVLSRFGMDLRDANEILNVDGLSVATLRGAVWQSRSRVKNTSPANVKAGSSAFLSEYGRWKHFVAVGIYTAYPPKNLSTWIVLFWTNDPQCHPAAEVASFDSKDVGKFLELWSQHQAAGDLVPQITSIVVALDGMAEFAEVLKRNPIFLFVEEFRSKLCWYLLNGVFEFIYGLIEKKLPVFVGRIDMPEYEQHHQKLSQLEYDGIVLVVAQVTDTHVIGLFVRAMRHQSFAPLKSLIAALVDDGKVEWMTDKILREAQPIGTEAFAVSSTFWDEY